MIVGDDVTIGHRAIVHGTRVGNGVTIGMGSIVLSRSTIGKRAVIAAVAGRGRRSWSRPAALMMGIPAKEKRILDEERQAYMMRGAARYVENATLFVRH